MTKSNANSDEWNNSIGIDSAKSLILSEFDPLFSIFKHLPDFLIEI